MWTWRLGQCRSRSTALRHKATTRRVMGVPQRSRDCRYPAACMTRKLDHASVLSGQNSDSIDSASTLNLRPAALSNASSPALNVGMCGGGKQGSRAASWHPPSSTSGRTQSRRGSSRFRAATIIMVDGRPSSHLISSSLLTGSSTTEARWPRPSHRRLIL